MARTQMTFKGSQHYTGPVRSKVARPQKKASKQNIKKAVQSKWLALRNQIKSKTAQKKQSSGQNYKKAGQQKQSKSKAIAKRPVQKKQAQAAQISAQLPQPKGKKAKAQSKEEGKELSKKEQNKLLKMAKGKTLELNPNNNIPNIVSNPLLGPTTQKPVKGQSKGQAQSITRNFELKDCCVFCNNREILQCVRYGDVQGLKKCLKDIDHISNPFQQYSVELNLNAFYEAIKNKNTDMLKLMMDYETAVKEQKISRVKLPSVSLQKQGTGQANKFQFYFPIRQVQLSRGGKEGNNAFTHDIKLRKPTLINYNKIIKLQPSVSVIKFLQLHKDENSDEPFMPQNNFKDALGKIARTGNFDLLKYVMKGATENQGYGFNKLHSSAVLQGNDTKTLGNVSKPSLFKKAYDNLQLSPGHLAAVNPDPTIFQKYFVVHPSANILDIDGRDLVHYAAANENSDVIEYIISKREQINNRDQKGVTPLMIASKLGRIHNVQAIIQEQNKLLGSLDEEADDYAHYKTFHNYSNTTGPYKQTSLHYATKNGHLNVVKYLVEEGGADMEAKNFHQNTALSVASEKGYLDIVKYLIEQGANIHGTDKHLKSPLIRACINGQIQVVSYLLQKGVNPNFMDDSGNTALHYACAYGWLNIVHLLIDDGGADPNILNEWKTSAILIAMLKGHFGIVDYLINLKSLNAQFQDDEGRTLIAQLCMNINEDSAKNLKFLLNKGKIDINIKDAGGFSPLHHLAKNNIQNIATEAVRSKDQVDEEAKVNYIVRRGKKIKKKSRGGRRNRFNNDKGIIGFFTEEEDIQDYNKRVKDLEQSQQRCAELLVKAGLTIQEKSNEQLGGMTPLFIAIMCHNYNLAEWLISKDPKAIQGKVEQGGFNILHLLSESFYFYDSNILPLLIKGNRNELKQMAYQESDTGYSPFLMYFNELQQANTLASGGSGYQQTSSDGITFIQTTIIPRSLKILKNVIVTYANELNYDITSQVGLIKDAKLSLERYKKAELISEEEYRLIKSLQYQASQNEDNNKNEEIKGNKDKNKVDEYKYDEIENFNPNKKQMGLIKQGYAVYNAKVQKNYNYVYYARRNKITQQNKEAQEDIGFQTIEDLYEKFKLEINDFYKEDTLKTALHILIKEYSKLKDDEDPPEQLYLDIVNTLLQLSSSFIDKNNKNQDMQGFNKMDKNEQSPLQYSINHNQKEFVKAFIDSKVLNLNLQTPMNKLGILHILSKIKNKEIIDQVLKINKQLDINAQDKNGNTPLHYASFLRNQYYVEQLLKFGAKINLKNLYGYNALHMSLCAYSESKDHTPKIERLLLDEGIDINALGTDGRSPIFFVFYHNEEQSEEDQTDPANLIMTLVKNDRIKLNVQDKNGCSPLYYACMAGATISALTMINSGADIKCKNIWGSSILSRAMQFNKYELSILMLQNGCSVDDKAKALDEKTKEKLEFLNKTVMPKNLKQALNKSTKQYKDQLDYIIQNYDIKDVSLFQLAIERNQGGISHLLIQKNYDIFDAMASCLKMGKYELFMDLLENNENVNIQRKDNKNRNFIQHLIKKMAQETDMSELDRCFEILQILQTQYKLDITSTDIKGRNILHIIAKAKNLELFKAILKKLNPNQKKLLLNQKDKIKQAIPVIYLFKFEQFQNEQKTEKLKDIDLESLDLTYTKKIKIQEKNNVLIPYYLQDLSKFPQNENKKEYKTTLLHKLIQKFNEQSYSSTINNVITQLLKVGFDFNLVEPETGKSILISAVLMNNFYLIQVLLGYVYDAKKYQYNKKKAPLVNINLADKEGKTALHYAIKPNDYGVLMNINVQEILLESKADPFIKDKLGFSSYDYAVSSPQLLELIQKTNPKSKINIKAQKDKNPKSKQIKTQKSAIIQNGNKPYDIDADAEEYFEDLVLKKRQEKMEFDLLNNIKNINEVKVDPISKLEKTCQVVKDPENGGHYFDTLMIKCDVKRQFYGINNFYIIQIFFDRVKNIYILWTRWGRIGYNEEGQYQRTPFQNLDDCVKEFKKVFRTKTGTKWEDVDNYTKVPKKYNVKRVGGKIIYQSKNGMHWSFSDKQIDVKDFLVDLKEVKKLKSKLTENELSFVKAISDQANIIRSAKTQYLQKDRFIKGLIDTEVLTQMKEILVKVNKIAKKKEQARSDKNFDLFSQLQEEIFEISSEYYELVCPIEFSMARMQSLDNKSSIQGELYKLQIIYDFEHTTKLLFGAMHRAREINPYDYIFNSLSTKLHQIPEESDEFKLILRYINNSTQQAQDYQSKWNNCSLNAIFEISEVKKPTAWTKSQLEKSEETFANTHNHFMLFHGTSNANILSIIEQGMVITPKNTARTIGQAYGEGVYFADTFQLASQYSDMDLYATSDNGATGDFCILLCEVALGNVCNFISRDYDIQIPKIYNSLRVMSSTGPDFQTNLMREDGVIWPIGHIMSYGQVCFKGEDKEEYSSFYDMKKKKKTENNKKPMESNGKSIHGEAQRESASKKPQSDSDNNDSDGSNEENDDNDDEDDDDNDNDDDEDDVIMIDTSSKKQKKNGKQQKKSKKSKMQLDSGDEDEESDKSSEEDEDQVSDTEINNAKEYCQVIDPQAKKYKIEPNVVSFAKFQPHEIHRQLYYTVNEAQYVIFNPDQIRVRYILHFSADKPLEKEEEEEDDDDNESDEEVEND